MLIMCQYSDFNLKIADIRQTKKFHKKVMYLRNVKPAHCQVVLTKNALIDFNYISISCKRIYNLINIGDRLIKGKIVNYGKNSNEVNTYSHQKVHKK